VREVLIAAVSLVALAGSAEAKIRYRISIPIPLHHHVQAKPYVAPAEPFVAKVVPQVVSTSAAPGDFDIGSGQHHVDIRAGTLPIEHDENAACERSHAGYPDHIADCEMYENKFKREAERLWPKVSDDRRKECLGSLD
jgi:hypothetical protein